MWLISCGMQRSGSTLQYQIAVKIAQTQPKVKLLGWVSPAETAKVFGRATDSNDTWVLAKLHYHDAALEAFCQKVNPKLIYIYRDLRDVVVSTMNMESWAFDSVEIASTINYSLRNYRLWTEKPGVLVSRYEDVMAEGGLRAEVEKIARYMGIDLPPEKLDEIAAAVSIKENKRRIEQFDYEKQGVQYPNTRFDPNTLFHNNHIHSGASEQWRAALTPEQVAVVETWAYDWLKERGYPLVETLPDAERIGRLHRLLEEVQLKSSEQMNRISGMEAFFKGTAQLGDDLPEEPLDASSADVALRERVNHLNGQVRAYKMQLAALRHRKIVRLMAKLGRPLV